MPIEQSKIQGIESAFIEHPESWHLYLAYLRDLPYLKEEGKTGFLIYSYNNDKIVKSRLYKRYRAASDAAVRRGGIYIIQGVNVAKPS